MILISTGCGVCAQIKCYEDAGTLEQFKVKEVAILDCDAIESSAVNVWSEPHQNI